MKRIVRTPLALPRAGQTVYSHYGHQIQIIRATRTKVGCFADCWQNGKRIKIEFKTDGSMSNRSLLDIDLDFDPFRESVLFKRYWHYSRKKAMNRSPMVRFLTGRKIPPVHFITAKAPIPGEYKEPSYLDSLSGSCSASAMVDAQVFVSARIIEDPNNPENNNRPIVMKMSKSRLDGLYQLAKDLKELK